MRIDYSFVEFHEPVFSQGKNFGKKVYVSQHTGMKLYHDSELKHVAIVMEYKGHTTHFGSYHSADIGVTKQPEQKSHAMTSQAPTTSATAQVGTPMQGIKPKKETIAKYQGE